MSVRLRWLLLMAGIGLVALAGCGSSSESGPKPEAGSQSWSIEVDGAAHEYRLFVPTTVDEALPAPLVVSLHGLGESATRQHARQFNDVAETEGIVVAYPASPSIGWNFDTDRELVSAIIDQLSDTLEIDSDRVYAIGHSQGGRFATYLACHFPDRFAAVASVGMMYHSDPPTCPAPSPTRVLAILGETDQSYSIEDGLTNRGTFSRC